MRFGLNRLTTLILGPNTLVQGVLPQMLHNTPDDFYEHSVRQLEANANLLVEKLSKVPGIKVIKPSGAMYVMVLALLPASPSSPGSSLHPHHHLLLHVDRD